MEKNMVNNLKLNNGREMPVIGLGTYKSPDGKLEQAVKDAIDAGYRHFDCAWFYGNESDVGKGIHAKIADGTIKREDVFITSKLWNNFHSKEKVVPMLKETLKSLNMDYIDLYLIHWPFGFKEVAKEWPIDEGAKAYSDTDYLETWQGMEECVNLGLAKSIGISNFNSEQIDRLYNAAKIKPVCNQVEVNLNFNQKDLIDFCKQKGIVIVAYCPLGRPEGNAAQGSALLDPKIINIAEKYNKTSAQIALNYLVKILGVSVIPKSVTKSRIIENFNILDFDLSREDIQYLESIHKNKRLIALSAFSDHKYYPFNADF